MIGVKRACAVLAWRRSYGTVEGKKMSKWTEEVKQSEIPGGVRETTVYSNGTSRDVDITTSSGEKHVIVTDHDGDGNSVSGDGAYDWFSSDYVRLNKH